MSGLPLLGSIYATQPGHELNNKLLKKIFQNKDNFKIIELNPYHISTDYQENTLNNNVA